ncbi:MAG: C69 family dipeptidase [Acidobacteria bacterium]|nr:C69 family dipeptidase [Acidobacteriota bacterium]
MITCPRPVLTGMIVLFGMCLSPLLAAETADEGGCTTLICGKNTTMDGSILFAKSEDDNRMEVDYLWYVPRQIHLPGTMRPLHHGGEIPQVETTWAYLWDQAPGIPFSNLVVNEWGVALGSNMCVSREESLKQVLEQGDLAQGGLEYDLRIILAERAKTAREAVLMAAQLLDTYGYRASGRCLNIVGPDEAWQLQIVRGRQYVARRVQDDEVAVLANTFSIREVDIEDTANFICSPRLMEYAAARGWYDPASGRPFDFALAYAPQRSHTNPGNTNRQWNLARLVNSAFPVSWQEAQQGVMPAAVKPDRKLSLKDVMAIYRSHYEGTELDESQWTSTGAYQQSPHLTRATICSYLTHRVTVIQQRADMPPEVGTVIWRALDQPCSSVFVPWYLGATTVAPLLQHAPENRDTTTLEALDYHFHAPREAWNLDLDSASAIFTLLGQMVDADYELTHEYVQHYWREFEDRAMALQPELEKTALRLYEANPARGAEFLSVYCNGQAYQALETARRLINDIKRQRWGTTHRNRMLVPGKVSLDILPDYAGRYDLADGRYLTVDVNGNRLCLMRPNESVIRLICLEPDRFADEFGEIFVRFTRDDHRRVSGIEVTGLGQDFQGQKIR